MKHSHQQENGLPTLFLDDGADKRARISKHTILLQTLPQSDLHLQIVRMNVMNTWSSESLFQ